MWDLIVFDVQFRDLRTAVCGRQRIESGASMRNITRVIARRVQKALSSPRRPRDELLAVFRSVAKVVKKIRDGLPEFSRIQELDADWAKGRLVGLRYAITNKYRDASHRRLTAPEVDPQVEVEGIARMAMDEIRRHTWIGKSGSSDRIWSENSGLSSRESRESATEAGPRRRAGQRTVFRDELFGFLSLLERLTSSS
jgi:hypothetical protein